MSSPTSTNLGAIQKPKNKRTILPKKSLIQLYIKTPEIKTQATTFGFKTTGNCDAKISGDGNGGSGSPSTKASKKHFNLIKPTMFPLENFEPNQSHFFSKEYNFSTVNNPNQAQKNSNPKKCVKEKKIQEITRMYLDESNRLRQHLNIDKTLFKSDNDPSQSNECENIYSKKQSLILNHLAREFFLDCRQRMEANNFRLLLQKLNEHIHDEKQIENQKSILDYIYDLIKADKNLCNKFSAFLTSEYSLIYDLQMQTIQYEKCFEFFTKLELFITNKCTFKKLINLIISSSNFSHESDTCMNKIDDIKARIKAITKNNPLVNYELEYMFDQRYVNLEPAYEKVSLLNKDFQPDLLSSSLFTNDELNGDVSREKKDPPLSNESLDEFDSEYIDLTNEHPLDYGTKKCSCKCHNSSTSAIQKSDQYTNEEILLQQQFGHCLLCSLKVVKGKLYIKCEGKKAMALNYKIT